MGVDEGRLQVIYIYKCTCPGATHVSVRLGSVQGCDYFDSSARPMSVASQNSTLL